MPENDNLTPESSESSAQVFSREYVAALRQEAASYRVELRETKRKVDELQSAVESAKSAVVSEAETLKAQLAERERELQAIRAQQDALQLNALRAKVAGELGLPAELAERLAGASEDELKADAEKLAKALPQTTRRAQNTTPIPSGTAVGETIEQKKARLLWKNGGASPIFKRGES